MSEVDDERQYTVPKIELSVGLVHWPVVDKAGNTVVTNVTNLDVHDIGRASTTYGVKKYYIINKLQDQLAFVSRILEHWRIGYGKSYNHKRMTALSSVEIAETIEKAKADMLGKYGVSPVLVTTSANKVEGNKGISFAELRKNIWTGMDESSPFHGRPVLLIFGTGWGLHDDVLAECDLILEPIKGMPPEDYRHLSVRSAVSICLDRILGKW